jgi:hypothetical protein
MNLPRIGDDKKIKISIIYYGFRQKSNFWQVMLMKRILNIVCISLLVSVVWLSMYQPTNVSAGNGDYKLKLHSVKATKDMFCSRSWSYARYETSEKTDSNGYFYIWVIYEINAPSYCYSSWIYQHYVYKNLNNPTPLTTCSATTGTGWESIEYLWDGSEGYGGMYTSRTSLKYTDTDLCLKDWYSFQVDSGIKSNTYYASVDRV